MFARVFTLIMTLLLATACSTSEFASDTPQAPKPAVSPEVNDQGGEQDDLDTDIDADQNGDDDDNDDGGDTDLGDNDDEDETDTTQDGDVTDDGDNPDFLGQIIDMFANLDLGGDDEGEGEIDENEINFGERGKIFHIGDGEFSASSCRLGLIFKEIKGTRFHFYFEVKEDNTDVNIDITHVCGVDYSINELKLLDRDGQEIKKLFLSQGAKEMALPRVTLDAGRYEILVQSPQNPNNNQDRDNFKLGNVKVKANKPVAKGDVVAD